MSIALESNTSNRIERAGFVHGMSCISVYDSPEPGRPITGLFAGDRPFPASKMTKNVVQEREEELDSCSSSSIGRNSDSSGRSSDGDDGSGDGEGEVQSSYKGPLDNMDSLEEVLPIKRGISKFYCGKSKSFTSLSDASSCSSAKDIVKPENAYTRKRKNLLAYNNFWDKNRNYPLRSTSGGISKRPIHSSRSTLALAVTMSSSSDSNSNCENSNSLSPLCLPPLYPHSRRSSNNELPSSPPQRNLSPWRSFSLSDLQCAAAATPSTSGLLISNGDTEDKPH